MYRDDLEAALARNHDLERQVRELQHAAASRTSAPSPAPPSPERPRDPCVPATRPALAYVHPAYYFPALPAFRCWFWLTLAWFGEMRPSVAMPVWWSETTSDVLLLELARWPLLAVWLPLELTVRLVAWIGSAIYLAVSVPLMAIGTLVISVLGLPLIAALGLRRGTATTGLQWGAQPDDTTAWVFAVVVLGAWAVLTPIVTMIAA